jgi:hypothetical protein
LYEISHVQHGITHRAVGRAKASNPVLFRKAKHCGFLLHLGPLGCGEGELVHHAADTRFKTDQDFDQFPGIFVGNGPLQHRRSLGRNLDGHSLEGCIATLQSIESFRHLARQHGYFAPWILKSNLLAGTNYVSLRLTLTAPASLIAGASLIVSTRTGASKLPLTGRGARLLTDPLIADESARIVASSNESAGRCSQLRATKLRATLHAAERLATRPAQAAAEGGALTDHRAREVTANLTSGALRAKLAGRPLLGAEVVVAKERDGGSE